MGDAVTLNRADLTRLFGSDPKAVQAFDYLFRLFGETSDAVASGTDATTAIQNASVVTLGPNAAFTNERVLVVAGGLTKTDDGTHITLSAAGGPTINGGYPVTLNVVADTNLDLPISGKVLTDDFSGLGNYVDDVAAAAGGVAVGHLYRTASALKVRVT